MTALQGDFYTVAIPGPFDAVCLFETFGMGSDAEQRRLLRRIAAEWLVPGGGVIMDVYHPFGPIRKADSSQALDRFADVTGSADMTERSYYDAILGRWIDEWEPVGDSAATRRQSIRCYTPADLLLLLEGTGLQIVHAECAGTAFDPNPGQVSTVSHLHDFESDYAYTVILTAENSDTPSVQDTRLPSLASLHLLTIRCWCAARAWAAVRRFGCGALLDRTREEFHEMALFLAAAGHQSGPLADGRAGRAGLGAASYPR